MNVSCACPAPPCERPSTGHAVRLVFDVLFAAASRVLSRTRLHTSFVCGCVLRVPSVDQPPRLPFVTGCTRTFVAVEWGWRRPRDLQLPLQCVWRCRRRRMACSGWCSRCGAVCPRELVVVVPRSSATNMVDIRLNDKHSGLPDVYSRPHDPGVPGARIRSIEAGGGQRLAC